MAECTRCAAATTELFAWRCGTCGAPLETPRATPSRDGVDGDVRGLARYRRWLGVDTLATLGEAETPLVEVDWNGAKVLIKFEGTLPTGSFKDRGSAVLFSALREQGATGVVEDSSGNAGASFSAYAACCGIGLDLFVPASASPAKLAQSVAHGARVHSVEGPRQAATDAAVAFADQHGAIYASHQWQPAFNLGTQSFAFELWEQLGERVPDVVVCPVGAGGMLLGAHAGFGALSDAGLAPHVPRVIGVQSAACAPLAEALSQGLDDAAPIERGDSVAEGVLITRAPRAREIIAATRASGGTIVALGDDFLWAAHDRLRQQGLLVELTSALALAALEPLRSSRFIAPGETVVVAATGHGLKTAQSVVERLGRKRPA